MLFPRGDLTLSSHYSSVPVFFPATSQSILLDGVPAGDMAALSCISI